jgi:phage terminase small subunit
MAGSPKKRARKEAAAKPANDKLTPKQEAFIEAYFECDKNASKAYRRSYNPKNSLESTIWVEACKLLSHPKVAPRIAAREAEQRKIAEDKFSVTQERILAELARCALYRADEMFTWGGDGKVTINPSSELTPDQIAAVVGVAYTPSTGKVEIKLADKLAALDKLARTLGMFKERTEHTGKDGAPLFPELVVTFGKSGKSNE